MGNLGLVAGIVLACVVLLIAVYFVVLPYVCKLYFRRLKLAEKAYEPLLMLEDMGRACLGRIGDKEIELIFDVDKNLPARLYGDEERLRQVISSLLANCARYVEKGYIRLLVKIYPVIENEMIEMYVSVKDTGVGIGPKELKRLFAFHGKLYPGAKKSDTGCGLHISQQLIKKMGGEIRVKSEEGKGSEFWFSLHQKIADPAPAAAIKLPEKGRAPRVSAKFSNSYREEALMTLLNMYKVSFIPYDILQDVGMTVDYLFTDWGVYHGSEQEMEELVRRRENICVLENPLCDHGKAEGVSTTRCPLFSLNFCQFLSGEQMAAES